jgi:hypothetical protein
MRHSISYSSITPWKKHSIAIVGTSSHTGFGGAAAAGALRHILKINVLTNEKE